MVESLLLSGSVDGGGSDIQAGGLQHAKPRLGLLIKQSVRS